jgi:hypothetical protein
VDNEKLIVGSAEAINYIPKPQLNTFQLSAFLLLIVNPQLLPLKTVNRPSVL